MAFQDLRIGSTVYVIDKTNSRPKLEISKVSSEPVSRLKQQEQQPTQIGVMPQPQKVIDIVVQAGTDTTTINGLPSTFDFSDMKDYVVSTNRNLVEDYAKSQKDNADNILKNQEYYEEQSAGYGEIIKQLNPELAAQERRDEEVKSLSKKVETLTGTVGKLAGTVDRLIELFDKPTTKK